MTIKAIPLRELVESGQMQLSIGTGIALLRLPSGKHFILNFNGILHAQFFFLQRSVCIIFNRFIP